MTRWIRLGCAVAVSAVAVVAPGRDARAAAALSLLDGPESYLVDVSDNGRYVLVQRLGTPALIIDRTAGVTRPLPDGVTPGRLSGDGSTVFFDSDARLLVADDDDASDVYAYRLVDGRLTLMSPGWPGWLFRLERGDADVAGNHVTLNGANPNGMDEPGVFIGDGTKVVRLNVPDGIGSGSEAVGISGDGRFALLRIAGKLSVADSASGALVAVNTGGAPAAPGVVGRLSLDGRHVVFATATFGQSRAYLFDVDTGKATDLGEISTQDEVINLLSLTANGSVVSLPRLRPLDTPAGTFEGTALFLWKSGVFTEVAAPTSGNPSLFVSQGRVLADGSTVVLGASGTGVDPAEEGRRVYVNRAEASPTFDPNPYPPISAPPPLPPITPPPIPQWGAASAFTPTGPRRILDTRDRSRPPNARPQAYTSIVLRLGDAGVPADATAVAVQVTATGGAGSGYVSAISTDSVPGQSSTLNLDVAGETSANFAVVPVGRHDGNVSIFTSIATELVVDLLGWWTPAPIPVAAGRYSAVPPTRLLDTRPTSAIASDGAKPIGGSTTLLQVAGRGGVPSSGVAAVAINVTVADTGSPGFVQVAPAAGFVPGSTSTVNVSVAGQVVAASTIVPVDADGRIALFNQSSANLIVDVAGWFTDGSAAPSNSGLFVPATSVTRVLDSRPTVRIGADGTKPAPGGQLSSPGYGSALVGNVTLTETDGAGYVQLGPRATLQPGTTSNINASGPGETLANAFISPVDDGLGIFTVMSTHIIVDVSGYMTR